MILEAEWYWTSVGLCIREGSFRIIIADGCNFPSSFSTKDGALESETSMGDQKWAVGVFYPKPLSSQLLHIILFPGSVCCVIQGAILYQCRWSYCISHGLILVDNLVKVWPWCSWNSWYLGNKQGALAHGTCSLRQVGEYFSRASLESLLRRAIFPFPSTYYLCFLGENDIDTINGTSWPHLGQSRDPFRR